MDTVKGPTCFQPGHRLQSQPLKTTTDIIKSCLQYVKSHSFLFTAQASQCKFGNTETWRQRNNDSNERGGGGGVGAQISPEDTAMLSVPVNNAGCILARTSLKGKGN